MHLDPELTLLLRALVLGRGAGCLATLHDGKPFASMVPFAATTAGGRLRLVVHVSGLAAHTRDVEALRAEVASLRTEVQRQRAELSDAVRHVSVVRYDAFGDMGGRLSFSAALLDDGGDGIVLTAIHGRTDTRTYVKGILGGTADQLSPEEKEAITVALTGNRS